MEFKHFCQARIEAVARVLESEQTQYDKWGDVQASIDLSFATLSNQYQQAAEAMLDDRDSVDLGETAQYQDTSQLRQFPNRSPEAQRDPMDVTMEVKSVKLKQMDSKKLQKTLTKGNSMMQDSREETMSDNEDSSMLMDDSNLDNSNRKAAQQPKKTLLKDVLRGQEANQMELLEEERSPSRRIDQDKGALDTTTKKVNSEVNMFGENYLYDGDIENVLSLLARNRTFSGKVDLSGQKFTDQTLLKLSKVMLQPQPQIVELNLERNPNFESLFGTQGISELAESVAESKSLKVLKLGGINFGFEGQW